MSLRYRLHRVLPMRTIDRVERWLRRVYVRTGSDWSRTWLDRVSWFTTPYVGARMDSGLTDALSGLRDERYYKLSLNDTNNVRWEMYRTRGSVKYRALGLTGGSHGR